MDSKTLTTDLNVALAGGEHAVYTVQLYLEKLEADESVLQKTAATVFFRKLITVGVSYELDYRRIIRALLNLIQQDDNGRMRATNSDLLYIRKNCAWALTNIVCISQEQCHALVEQNGVDILFSVATGLAPSGSELKMQCIWVLANIAADCTECKEKCRQTNICQMLTTCLENYEFYLTRDVQNIVWCLHNVLKRGLDLDQHLAISMSHMVYEVMLQYQNTSNQLLVECLWTLSCIADDPNVGRQINAVLQCPNIVREVFKMFHIGNEKVKHGCLRLLGNIVTGTEEQTAAVVNQQNFYSTIVCAMNTSVNLCHEAIWMCSNVAASAPIHIEQLFHGNEIIKKIIFYATQGENKLRKEAHWALVNLLRGSEPARVHRLIIIGVLFTFPSLVASEDSRIVERCLSSLRDVLGDYPHWTHHFQNEKILEKINANLIQNADIQNLIHEIQLVMSRHQPEILEPYTFVITS